MPLQIGPFFLGKPSEQDVQKVVTECPRLPFNFPHPTATRTGPPPATDLAKEGFAVDHNRVQVGKGRAAYRQARDLVRRWRHFHLGWAFVNDPPLALGAPVVVTAQSLFLWTCNPLRVSFVEEGAARLALPGGKQSKGHRLAFAHTTLRGHQISGEERFAVEWHPQDDSVWFDIYTVSKPATPIAALAYPLLRFYQRRFVHDSMAALKREMAPAPRAAGKVPAAAGKQRA